MTKSELEYIRKANELLLDPRTPRATAIKTARTVGQIYERLAQDLELTAMEEKDLVDRLSN